MDEDRNDIPIDEKWRVLDYFPKPITPPSTGIYEGELRYYAANKEWATIIEGLIDFLATPAAWAEEVTDESHHAIQQILIFEEGIDIMPDPLDTYEAIKMGIYDAVNDIAKQIVSGRVTDIVVGSDGTVTDPTTGLPTDDLPEDDPETPLLNENSYAKAGAAYEIAQGYNSLIKKVHELHGPTTTPVVALADAQFIIKALYQCDDGGVAMDAAMAQTYATRAASGGAIIDLGSGLEEALYCGNLQNPPVYAYIMGLAVSLQAKKDAIALLQALGGDNYQSWYNEGITTPSTNYIEFGCTPFDSETIVFSVAAGDFAGSGYKTGAVVNKNSHRVRLDVSGKIVDSVVGGYHDFFWQVDADGTKHFIGISGNRGTFQVTTNWDEPTAEEVPFRADGIYAVTRETFLVGCTFLTIRRKMTSPVAGGSFTMLITDLGDV